jgi:hypothetical protein
MERKVSALLDNTTSPARLHVGVVRFHDYTEIVFLPSFWPQVAIDASMTHDGYIRLKVIDEEYRLAAQDDGSVIIEPK